jgi:hypothetical protein
MQRELLLCLAGHGGDSFARLSPIRDGAGSYWRAPRFAMNESTASTLDASDRAAVRALLPTASTYTALCEFASTPSTSLYVTALSEELVEQLGRYREVLVLVESELGDCPRLPVTHIRQRLSHFPPILDSVLGLVVEVEESRLSGGSLLNRLHAAAQSGFPGVRDIFEALLHRCHQVLFNQIISWTVYGLLPEGSSEFFIEAETSPSRTLAASKRQGTGPQAGFASGALVVRARTPLLASCAHTPHTVTITYRVAWVACC